MVLTGWNAFGVPGTTSAAPVSGDRLAQPRGTWYSERDLGAMVTGTQWITVTGLYDSGCLVGAAWFPRVVAVLVRVCSTTAPRRGTRVLPTAPWRSAIAQTLIVKVTVSPMRCAR